MATLRSNKENLSVGFAAPKTPGAKPQANASMFTTPKTTSRVPLGGKDRNANHFTVQKQSVKRQPLSGPSSTKKKSSSKPQLAEKQVTIAEPDDDDDFEIEFMPEKPQPLEDLPLDHIDLDYNAVGQLCKQPSFHEDEADVFKKPVSSWLDNLDKIPVLTEITTNNNPPPPSSKPKPQPSKKEPLKPRTGAGAALKPKSSFMAPTKSAQAKQRVPSSRHRHNNKENIVMHHHPPPKKHLHHPPAMDVDVSMDQLHQSLEWDF
ncbi:hypothetical protein TRICI_002851 [Trichomonascus ciferrii]|uniref:Uncharacterized protein n=1 Tax=Trichomonascus ciferrii TaxID=44093 RepID=A0A642V6Q7_9ASCO|nr:hypothetical protein TRICI_002851 [Trichomonascus ciferrii]